MDGLPAVDQHGYPAFCCAADGRELTPLSEGSPVLQCPSCGHRTDQPGAGVLGDGFDICHRQWGLRGDPHTWSALRDLLAAAPTPSTREAVRDAFVDGLRQVIDVDIDRTEDSQVHRAHLDHGGMSGGTVDLGWWRTKGLPLLVDRAISRRPGADPAAGLAGSARRLASSVLIWAVVLAIPTALIGGGGWLLYQRAAGTRVEATVLSCDASGHARRYGTTFRTECVAEWTIDGQTVIGSFEGGGGTNDVGKTLDATVRGDTAYSRSLVLPALLVLFGLPLLLLPASAMRRRFRRGRPAETPAAGAAPEA